MTQIKRNSDAYDKAALEAGSMLHAVAPMEATMLSIGKVLLALTFLISAPTIAEAQTSEPGNSPPSAQSQPSGSENLSPMPRKDFCNSIGVQSGLALVCPVLIALTDISFSTLKFAGENRSRPNREDTSV